MVVSLQLLIMMLPANAQMVMGFIDALANFKLFQTAADYFLKLLRVDNGCG